MLQNSFLHLSIGSLVRPEVHKQSTTLPDIGTAIATVQSNATAHGDEVVLCGYRLKILK
jgi:hypothetical protein